MDLFTEFLQGGSPRVNPSDAGFYSGLGREAAEGLVEHGTDMNSVIAKLASRHCLNPEQTKRVVEAANNAAFTLLFEKNGGGYTTFPVAEASKIVPEAKKVKVASERYVPLSERVSTEDLLAAMFGESCITKAAEEAPAPVDKVDLVEQARNLSNSVEDAEVGALKKLAALQDLAASMVEGEEAEPIDIQRALVLTGASPEMAKLACAKTRPSDAAKFGSTVLVDPSHALIKAAAEFKASLEGYMTTKRHAQVEAKRILDAFQY